MNGKLCDISKRLFAPAIRSRGWEYFREHRVELKQHTEAHLEAHVQGNELYNTCITMKLMGSKADILMICDCPYYSTQGFCKHIWATLLLADLRSWIQPPEIISQYSFKDADDIKSREDWDVGDFSTTNDSSALSQRIQPAAGRNVSEQTSWQDMLKALEDEIMKGDLAAPDDVDADQPEAELRFIVPIETLFQTGRLYISMLIRSVRKDDSWGAWKPSSAAAFTKKLSHEDSMMLLLLSGADRSASHHMQDVGNNFRCLEHRSAKQLLPQLCATNRLFATYRGQEYGPLAWDDEEPWSDELDIVHDKQNKEYLVSSLLVRDSDRRPLSKPLVTLSEGWIIWPNAISQLLPSAGFSWVSYMRQQGTLRIPEVEISEFLVSLMHMMIRPPLSLPEELEFNAKQVKPVPHLHIMTLSPENTDDVSARVSFDYNGEAVGAWDKRAVLYQVADHVMMHRDRDAEQQVIDAFKEAGGRENKQRRYTYWNADIKVPRLPQLVSSLVKEEWVVEGEMDKFFRNAGSVNVSVASGIDWFDLHVKCDFDGISVSFPRLLEAINKKEKWIKLDDGSFGILPEEWLQKFGGIAALGQVKDEVVRFKNIQAGLLDVWLEAQPEVSVDEAFQQTRKKLRQFNEIEAVDTTDEFKGTLRPYQREGLGWLLFLKQVGIGGCLADDMGLGKTVQLLALLDGRYSEDSDEKHKPSLVVAPSSIIFNWMREASVFTPRLRFFDHTGIKRPKDLSVFDDYDAIVTTYGTLRRDIAKLKEYDFDFIVLDEAQAIKNAGAQTAKACRLLKGSHRIALSGTPIENHLTELWSLFEFLNPGLLGRVTEFNKRWGKNPEPEARTLLSKSLRPFILRRTKAQVAPDLPDRQEETLFCELPPKQRALYQELQQYYRKSLLSSIDDKGLNRSKMQVLEALLRLRQAACHPGLIDEKDVEQPSAKFELLVPQLREVIEEGHKALVFSQFTTFLGLLRTQLDNEGIVYEYLDGRTRKRQEHVDRFQQDPDCPLFLISLKAGGLGLNLTAAEYVFLLDPWWNPAVEAQAIDRAHRIGQTNKVFAYRLIARDTVEEKILELQESKRNLADAIINQDNALLRNLTPDDLAYLIG